MIDFDALKAKAKATASMARRHPSDGEIIVAFLEALVYAVNLEVQVLHEKNERLCEEVRDLRIKVRDGARP